jgi:hypothetical protein
MTSLRIALPVGIAVLACLSASAWAGPPYITDDPEPVEYKHWEVYLATQHEVVHDGASGTVPHLEINYGPLPNLQLHVIAPLAYARPSGGPTAFGPGDLELGAKFRFVQEGERVPMLGTFPLIEVPTGNASKSLGTGKLHAFLPLWLQKTMGAWSGYGGGGYWINPGAGNRNYWFAGWQAQRRFAELLAVGAEIFYTTADRAGANGNLRFNVGAIVDFSGNHHLLLSAGRSIAGDTRLLGYLAYQLTL